MANIPTSAPVLANTKKEEDTPMPDQTIPPPPRAGAITAGAIPPLTTLLPSPLNTLIPTLTRSTKYQETFAPRKVEIMRKFTLAQIQALYEEETDKILLMLEEDQRNNDDINRQIEQLEKQQEVERRIYSKMPGNKGRGMDDGSAGGGGEEKKGGGGALGLGIGGLTTDAGSVKGEEGEVLEGEDEEDVKMEGV